ncbi:cysteine-rich with EGF-like domain protein 2 [Micropterus salmoides]|uniref:cysteine-rich with EGF-like domain protein 2 n=1 Tax=Micropterus salmoides TaxID=27706 RepID=UPI0018EDE6A8|nr:cysteine-rich with EGF-like domain protein 2 [Micropterus salmoides]
MLSTGPELRLLRLLSCVTLVLLFQVTDTKRDLNACSTCRQITDNFNKGFDRTAKQNFGGGNTAWEERKLSKYETSEIRLMEIVEGLCDSSSFECNRMLEEHEDHFETWWFKRKTKHPDLHKWFCIETIKVCCPKGTFGPDCNACVGGSDRPCHGNGMCDGDGTRGGNGKCSCDHGYKGDFCLDCIDGYFNEVRNNTFSLCTECHSSCKTCTGATNQDCDECKEGWEEDDQEACIDINECSKDSSPCEEDEYCLNTEGSFSCKACDKACSGCTGAGPDKCQACASGYQDTEGTCTDIDECSQPESVCTLEHQECVNNKGSYVCICSSGYEEQDGECVQTLQPEKEEESEEVESEASETTASPHGEL